jgi:hypothetical protein
MDIIKRYIKQLNEQARARNKATSRMDDLADELGYHILKLMMYPSADEGTQHHWIKEIASMLKKAARIKLKGSRGSKKPSASMYREYLFDPKLENTEDIEDAIKEVIEDHEHYTIPVENTNAKEMLAKVNAFEKEILPLLEQRDSIQDNICQELIRKYFIEN